MSNPTLVEVTRGDLVESRHTGSVAVCDADGRMVLSLGDVGRPVFPRSAVKAFQALPLIESGAADRYGLTQSEIALAISSHGGEPAHVEAALSILAKAGREEGTLECGSHAPSHRKSAEALIKAGRRPSPAHNNCSGKHAGFICLACAAGRDPFGYVQASHPTMREVMGAMSDMTGAAMAGETVGIDGCSIPSQAVSLTALATGFARFGTGAGLGPARQAAAARLRAAAAAHPYMVAGTGRFCTRVMEIFGAQVFVKTGAEGVFCAAFPGLGYGVALKADDGGTRAAEAMMAAVIGKLVPLAEGQAEALAPLREKPLSNWMGVGVGAIRPAGELA